MGGGTGKTELISRHHGPFFSSLPLSLCAKSASCLPQLQTLKRRHTHLLTHTRTQPAGSRESRQQQEEKKGPKVVEQPCEDDDAGGVFSFLLPPFPMFLPFAAYTGWCTEMGC